AEPETEVAVEDVQRGVVDAEVDAQAPARLAAVARQIAAQRAQHRQPRQHGVAVGAGAAEGPRLAHHQRHVQTGGQVQGLVGRRQAVLAHDLLQADDVGRDLADDTRDALEVAPAVEPDPAVDVVAGDDQRRHAASWYRAKYG